VGKYGNSRTGYIWQYGGCDLCAGYLRQQTHTQRISNTYCFSTATVVKQRRLSVTSYVRHLSFYNSKGPFCLWDTNWHNLDRRQSSQGWQ
jgi:hypothetical protein